MDWARGVRRLTGWTDKAEGGEALDGDVAGELAMVITTRETGGMLAPGVLCRLCRCFVEVRMKRERLLTSSPSKLLVARQS